MDIRSFVSGSGVILLGWLGATFLNQVPAQRYPRLNHQPAAAQTEPAPAATTAQPADSTADLTHES